MRQRWRNGAFGFLAAAGAALVGGASSGDSMALRLVVVLAYVVLVATVVTRPALAVHYGLWALVLELFLSTGLLRLAGSALLLFGCALAWPSSPARQRHFALLLFALLSWVMCAGVLLAPPAAQQQGMALAFLFGASLATCAVLTQPSRSLVALHIGGWGLAATAWVLGHPQGLTLRGGDVAFGENADGLGMLIALGTVALVGFGLERRRALLPVIALAALLSLQALVITASRGALLALSVGLFTALVAHSWLRRPLKLAVGLAVVTTAAWFGAAWVTSHFLEASGRGVDAAYGFDLRARVAQFAWEQGLEHPLLGVGVARLQELATGTDGVGLFIGAHNTFLGLLAAAGFPAVVLLVSVLVQAARHASVASPRFGLSVLAAVTAAGFSLEWWPAQRLAPLFFLAIALSTYSESRVQEPKPGAPEATTDGVRKGRNLPASASDSGSLVSPSGVSVDPAPVDHGRLTGLPPKQRGLRAR